jgi:hypothetical protein
MSSQAKAMEVHCKIEKAKLMLPEQCSGHTKTAWPQLYWAKLPMKNLKS